MDTRSDMQQIEVKFFLHVYFLRPRYTQTLFCTFYIFKIIFTHIYIAGLFLHIYIRVHIRVPIHIYLRLTHRLQSTSPSTEPSALNPIVLEILLSRTA